MNPQLIKFQWSHLDGVRLRTYDRLMFDIIPDGRTQLQHYLDTGLVYTGIIGGEIIMIGGVSIEAVSGFVWLLTSDLTSKYKIFFFKSCKRFIELSIKHFKLTHVETTVLNDDKISHAWVKRLGFKKDREERNFGLDFSVYARII